MSKCNDLSWAFDPDSYGEKDSGPKRKRKKAKPLEIHCYGQAECIVVKHDGVGACCRCTPSDFDDSVPKGGNGSRAVKLMMGERLG